MSVTIVQVPVGTVIDGLMVDNESTVTNGRTMYMTAQNYEAVKARALAYSCPVCGASDPNQYTRCHRPDCTDGRDPR